MKSAIVVLAFVLQVFISFNTYCEEQPTLMLPIGHAGEINSVAISPDNKYALSGSEDKTMKLWDISSGKVLRSFTGFTDNVKAVCFSPDGKLALSGSSTTMTLWDISTGNELQSFVTNGGNAVYSVCFSPDGRFVLSGNCDKTLKLWDISTGKEIRKFIGHRESVESVCFSPDGRYALSGSWDKTMKLWDIKTGKTIKTFLGHTGWVNSVCFSPDGKSALSGSQDCTMKLWDINSGRQVKTFLSGPNTSIKSVCFSPDGKSVLSESVFDIYNCLKLRDIATGKELKIFKGQNSDVEASSLCFSPDGKFIVSGGNNNIMELWDVGTGNELKKFKGNTDNVVSVSFSPDGKFALAGSDSTLKLWDLYTGKALKSFITGDYFDNITSVCFSPDGKFALSGSKNSLEPSMKLWDISSGKELRSFKGHTRDIFGVCFSSDGTLALSGSADNTMKLWDINTGNELRSFAGNKHASNAYDGITSVCFSPDGKLALSGSEDSTVQLWDIGTGKKLKTLTENGNNYHFFATVNSVCFSPDGNYALAGSYSMIKLWDVNTGKELFTSGAHYGDVNSVRFSPDGRFALSGSADNTMILWDLAKGTSAKTFRGHTFDVNSVSFSPDGKYALSGSNDKTIKLWDINSGKELCTMISIDSSDWVVTTPDGRFDGSENGMKMLYYVKGLDIIPLESMFEKFYTPGLLARVMAGEQFEAPDVNIASLQSPPIVSIVSPADSSSINDQTVTITVTATDKGGGVDEISLYQNGKLVETEQRGLKAVQQTGNRITKTFTVDLLNGENKFKVTAFNNQRTESTPAMITVMYNGISATSNLYVIAIGINQYANQKLSLNYARPDAESFVQEMSRNIGTLFKHITIIPLYDSSATKATVMASLDSIAAKATQGDVFVLYYAGHGSMTDNRFYFVTSNNVRLYERDALDKNAIYVKDMQDKLMAIKALKQVVIIDACQSGGAVEMLAFRGSAEEKAWAQLARSAGVHVLASTGTEQYANEFDKLGHGVFTYALLKGLEGQADGAPKDGKVTVKELSSYLDDQVPQLTKEYKGEAQYPNTFSKGQDFPLIINNQ